MDVEYHQTVIHSGTTLHGRLMATFSDRVTVKLEAFEASFPKPVTMSETEAVKSDGHAFELAIPANAIGFTAGRASITWKITASEGGLSGHDMEHPITIVAPEPAAPIDVTDSEIDELLAASAKKRSSLGNGEMLTVAMFMLMGLGLLGVGIVTAIAPPESFDGTRTPAFVMMAMSLCFFLPGLIRVRSVYRPSTIKGVEVVSHTRAVRRGQPVSIQLSLAGSEPLRVGFVTTLGTFAQLSQKHTSTRNRGGGFVYTTLHESWEQVDAANPTATFTVPAESAPTYSGRAVFVMHHLRVQRASSTSTKWNTRRLEVPVVVLP